MQGFIAETDLRNSVFRGSVYLLNRGAFAAGGGGGGLFIVAMQHRAVPEGEHASSQRRFGKGIAYGVQSAHADAVAAAAGAAKIGRAHV